LKVIVIVINGWWGVVSWLMIDYPGGAVRLGIRKTTWLVFGLPTTTRHGGGRNSGQTGGCVPGKQLLKLCFYCSTELSERIP
jgi:hypothetical protein